MNIFLICVYGILSTIPVWFGSYTVIRMYRHWNDGKDKYIVLNKHVYIKWFITLMMTILSLMHIVDLALYKSIDTITLYARASFFSLLVLSWLMSFVLAIFENNKRLSMKWTGHRSFWPANILIHLVFFIDLVVELVQAGGSDWVLTLLAVYTVQVLFCVILTLYALYRPNEFVEGKLDYTFIKRSIRKTTIKDLVHDGLEMLKVSIKSYKIKHENNKQVTYFNIITQIKSLSFVSKKTYQDFDWLNKVLTDKFPLSEYPDLHVPFLPNVVTHPLEERLKLLGDYLNTLSEGEFYIPEYLDFLNIKDPSRAMLLKSHEELFKMDLSLNSFDHRSTSIVEKYFTPRMNEPQKVEEHMNYSLQNFIDFSIERWIEIDSHVEYEFRWMIVNLGIMGTSRKRYNEFLDLHKALGKVVSPARLPKFPNKNILGRLSRADEKILFRRKMQLEMYMSHILNDFSFLAKESLEFLGANTVVERIWAHQPFCYQIKLQSPLICYQVIEDAGHHMKYGLKFAKFSEKVKKSEWAVKRRYSEFDEMHSFLLKRNLSPLLARYYDHLKHVESELPNLPNKTIGKLVAPSEIENRRIGLERYLEEILAVPEILQAYCFREFINDSENTEDFLIN